MIFQSNTEGVVLGVPVVPPLRRSISPQSYLNSVFGIPDVSDMLKGIIWKSF